MVVVEVVPLLMLVVVVVVVKDDPRPEREPRVRHRLAERQKLRPLSRARVGVEPLHELRVEAGRDRQQADCGRRRLLLLLLVLLGRLLLSLLLLLLTPTTASVTEDDDSSPSDPVVR